MDNIEYKNGRRITKFTYELSPLDAAMAAFEDNIRKHEVLVEKAFDADTIDKLPERKKEKQEALNFLKKERLHLQKIVEIHSRLEIYRKVGAKAHSSHRKTAGRAVKIMVDEEHHPTEDLEEYMRAEGAAKPSSLHTAHHIVPGKGKLRPLTALTRLHIHRNGIRINDPANGVYLLHKDEYTPHWSMPNSRGHLTYHTHDYERFLSGRIRSLTGTDTIKKHLQIVGRLLQQYEPKTAISKIRVP